MILFEVKTKRLAVDESNTYTEIKEQWLVQAETFTEAEANVTRFLNKIFPKDSVTFTGMKPSRIAELVKSQSVNDDDPDSWAYYKCTILRTGAGWGKRGSKEYICVKANDIEDANTAVLRYADPDEDTVIDSIKVEKTKFTGTIILEKKNG